MINKPKILSKDQVKFLKLFAEKKKLSSKFYFTGGTTLTEYYIPYRYSEDLDFFSEQEVDGSEVLAFLRTIKSNINYKTLDINTSFNRNIVILVFTNYNLKLEFTYFPFPRIDNTNMDAGINIDSVKDIAVNKLFTIYQNPRSRDFIDLYMINNKYGYSIEELIPLARSKFDWRVDPVQLGSQFLKATDLKDYPRFIKKINEKEWQEYFKQQAEDLRKSILE